MSLQAAILGFLALEPASGYTLRQRFEHSVGSFWTVTQSQVYRELHGLERGGLVAVRRERGDGKPDRKVYRLTEAGRRHLDAWLREPLEPLQLRHPLLLKFVFAADLPPAALDGLLARYLGGLEETRREYEARLSSKEIFSLARSKREVDVWRLAIEHGLAWCDAEAAWVTRARQELGRPARAQRARPKTPHRRKE
jgi:DNA-binding PadR family transcriptional regulator